MPFSALVIGHGSIGQRHAEILTAMDAISHVSVLSSQKGLPYESITSIEDIPGLRPDYVVVSTPTDQHYNQLKFLENHLKGKKY